MAATDTQRSLAERRFLTVPEVARMLNVPDRLVRRLIKQGALPAIRVGKPLWRVDSRHLEESLEELHATTRAWLALHPHDRDLFNSRLGVRRQARWALPQASPLPADAELMTVPEARRALELGSRHVYYLIRTGRLRARKAGHRWLVASEDVEALTPRARERDPS